MQKILLIGKSINHCFKKLQPPHMKKLMTVFTCAVTAASCLAANTTFTIDASRSAGSVSPKLYGLMTEEINHSYDGGLYAELVQNRVFLDSTNQPVHWSVVGDKGAASIALDSTGSFNDKLTTSLRLTVTQADKKNPAGVANSGYWGIPVMSKTSYRATILVRAEAGFTGPVTVSIVSDDDQTVFATGTFSGLTTDWKKLK